MENLNHCVTAMFLVAQPGYLHAPTATTAPRPRRGDLDGLLPFAEFTARLLDWVRWWNTEHRPKPLGGRTPLQAWQDDPTPIEDVPPALLRSFTLEDAGGDKLLSTKGVYWRGRYYVGPWMHGMDGTRVRVRFVPITTTRSRCSTPPPAPTSGQPTSLTPPPRPNGLRCPAKDAQRRTMVRALASADRQRRRLGRYGAITGPGRPELLAALTAAEVEELAVATGLGSNLAKRALPDLIPRARHPPRGPARSPIPPVRPRRRRRPAGTGTPPPRTAAPPRTGPTKQNERRTPVTTADRLGRLPAERDHYMRLSGAQVVGTRALLAVRENIRAAIEARAMICIYGRAGHGKSFAVNASLRDLAPQITHRIQFRARPRLGTYATNCSTRWGSRAVRPPTRSSSTACCAGPRGDSGAGVRRGPVAVEAVLRVPALPVGRHRH
ncbi:hypothetical protein [Kitasatospora sp. NA04385]|uniref:hypothetical protein n=1 Tax=Kitasatospora sp. NA04385 TaxID=2742135 RepID=UPI0020CAC729|nr:hypothetical protein [Kitasatospora sp. NA04385]